MQLGPSDKTLMEKIICEKTVSDFLKLHPKHEVRAHAYPFYSYSMCDVSSIHDREEASDYYIFLHDDHYSTVERFDLWHPNGCKVKLYRADFNPLSPNFINLIGEEYYYIRDIYN